MGRVFDFSPIKALFNIAKKFVDILDDLWYSMQGIFSPTIIQLLSPFILGGVGFLTHLGEGIIGIKEGYLAYKNEKIGQRKTRIATSVLTFMFAGAGLGLAASLIVAGLGATVSAATLAFAPALIPGFLAVIYSLALWRKYYIFTRAREEETKAKIEYDNCFSAGLLCYSESPDKKPGRKKKWEEMRELRLAAERDFAFNVVEVLSSVLVVTATIFGMAAIVGASLASAGALPFAAILIVGVVSGVACKLFEYCDEKKKFAYTRGLRKWFLEKWAELTNRNSPVTDKALPKEFRQPCINSYLHGRLAEENVIELQQMVAKNPEPSSPQLGGLNTLALEDSAELLQPVALTSLPILSGLR